jgi:hypothetical protein
LISVIAAALSAGCGTAQHQGAVPPARVGPPTCAAIFARLGYKPSLVAKDRDEGRCLAENLNLSGEVYGPVHEGVVDYYDIGSQGLCTKPVRGASWPPATLTVEVGDKAYHLAINPPGVSDHAASTADATGAIELKRIDAGGMDSIDYSWRSTAGKLTVNADGTNGTVDATLKRDANGAAPLRLKGSWRCGAAPSPLASPDPSIPCDAYYIGAGTSAGDIAKLKAAGACLPQNLTVTGGLSFHVAEGVNDPSLGSYSLVDLTGRCGGLLANDKQSYAASVLFAVGDEVFQLTLEASRDQFYGPLQFPDFGPSYPSVVGGTLPTVHLSTGKLTWSSTAGKFSVSDDRRSGTVDMDLAEPTDTGGIVPSPVTVNGGQPVHVAGSWRCAP